MIINSYNLYNYILQRAWNGFLFPIENILEDEESNVEIFNLDFNSPRNTLLCCKIKKETDQKIFVFKQPKFLTIGANWSIAREYKIYSFMLSYNPDLRKSYKHVLTNYFFDETYNILVTPYLQSFKSKNSDIAKILGENLAGFHLEINNTYNKTKTFRDCIKNFQPNYQIFLNQLIQGFRSETFLDENLFRNLLKNKSPVVKDKLYKFIWQNSFFEKLLELQYLTFDNLVIHGDVKQENILVDDSEEINLRFIDFETVSLGNISWDIACIIESYLSKASFKKLNSTERYLFFKTVFDSYSTILKNTDRSLLRKVLKYYALRLLERFCSSLIPDDFTNNLPIINKILTDTDNCIQGLENEDSNFIEDLFGYNK